MSAAPGRETAPHRVGEPSPLIFHLGVAIGTYGQALLAAPRADSASFPWAPGLHERAASLGGDLDRIEIAREIAARLTDILDGLERWQTHPYRRSIEDPPAVWSAGCSRLLDYGRAPEATDPQGPPVLVVPSLINRAYVLDLAPGRSILRWLAAQGLRPLLLDWGRPGAAERGFGMDEYGSLRLLPALEKAREIAGTPVSVLGYCMGGTMAAGLAARAPEGIASLATIGAPWDFSSTAGNSGAIRAAIRAEGPERTQALLAGLAEAFGFVPVPLFQLLFALVNPMQAALKFRRMARLDPDGPAARLFVAVEDWLADGVPMPLAAADDLLIGWHIRNDTARGAWRFLGGPVDPRRIALPTLCFCGSADTIAPPPLARSLARAIPGAAAAAPQLGHVGMVIGGSARGAVWRPLAEFLAGHAC
jgi:polyhydroxyalkanoate synthase subunit PhaC